MLKAFQYIFIFMEEEMKKALLLGLVLTALIAAPIFAGGQQETDSEEIMFWMQKYGTDVGAQEVLLKELTAKFKDETGITVKYNFVDWGQALTKYTLAATGGEAPDVADTFFAYSWVPMGGEKYGPLAIDDVAAELDADNAVYEFAKSECIIDGQWYGLPWRGDTRIAAYNKAHFDEAGIKEFPKTYEELLDVARKLTTYNDKGEVDRAGLLVEVTGARFDQSWFAVLAGFGGARMDKDFKNFTLNTQENIEALQFMQDAVYKHKVMPETVLDPTFSSMDAFSAGKASIIIGAHPGYMAVLETNAPQIAEVTKSAVMPSKTGRGFSSIAAVAPLVIYKTSNNIPAAKEWLKFFVRKDNLLKTTQVLGQIAGWKAVMEDPSFANDPWYSTIVKQNPRADTFDMPLPEWSQIDAFPAGPLNVLCTDVMAGEDVEESILKAEKAINEILSK